MLSHRFVLLWICILSLGHSSGLTLKPKKLLSEGSTSGRKQNYDIDGVVAQDAFGEEESKLTSNNFLPDYVSKTRNFLPNKELTLTPKKLLREGSTSGSKQNYDIDGDVREVSPGDFEKLELKFTFHNSLPDDGSKTRNFLPKNEVSLNDKIGSSVHGQKTSTHAQATFSLRAPTFHTQFLAITKSHWVKVTTTSDVWVTSVVEIPRFVTQYSTLRIYEPELPETVTSVVRISVTPISFVSEMIENVSLKTEVITFTRFFTTTVAVNLFHPVIHFATNFEILSLPLFKTTTLVQKLTSTTTAWITKEVTSTKYPVQSLYFLRY